MYTVKSVGALGFVAALLAGCGGASPATTTTASNGSTLIVVGRRIGPISLLESKAKIEAAYGKGQRVTLSTGQIVTFYRAVSIGVMYDSQGTWEIETASPLYRSKSGVGVGSEIGALRKIGADCSRTFSACNVPGVYGPVAHPAVSMVFYLNHKPFPTDRGVRVTRIDISLAG